MTFERMIEISPAFDRRSTDPKQNFGIHCVEIRFVLKGEAGAVQFLLFTNWHLPHVAAEFDRSTVDKARRGEDISVDLRCFYHPMAADRGYHSPVPQWEGQEPSQAACPYLDGKPCYYDGSSINAQVVYDALVSEGAAGLWRELEYYYHSALETPLMDRTVEGAEFGAVLHMLAGAPKPESSGGEK